MTKYPRFILTVGICLYFFYYALTYTEWHMIDSVNLIFHEAGHSILFFLGMFVQVLAGSAFQILIPAGLSLYFFIKKQNISASICLLWTGQNFLNVSIYARDAIGMNLPLLGGDSVTHDWNYILNSIGLLLHAPTIATVLYSVGVICICLGTIFALKYALSRPIDATSQY